MRSQIAKAVIAAIALAGIGYAPRANALPKDFRDSCACECSTNTAAGYTITNIIAYDSQELFCSAFNGATCNVEDPNDGMIYQGKLDRCTIGQNAPRISVLTGTVAVGPGVKVVRIRPRRSAAPLTPR